MAVSGTKMKAVAGAKMIAVVKAEAKPGAEVREVAVPKLIGLTPLEADRAITASGLQLVVERQYYSANIPEGKIMMQVPDAGSKVRRGWQVRAPAAGQNRRSTGSYHSQLLA